MFREMRRFVQKATKEECDNILESEFRGVLSVIGDDMYPYGVPMDFYYDKNKNKIYFHGAREGHKIDSIRKNNKVCFTLYNSGHKENDEWYYRVLSVVVFGKIKEVYDEDLIMYALNKIGEKYMPSADIINNTISKHKNNALVLELDIEHMSGKHIKEK